MKLFLFLIVLIISVSFSSAISIGISPEKLEFYGQRNELICRDFSIFGDNSSLFEGQIKWSRIDSKILSDYKFDSSSLKINTSFPTLINPGKYKICLSSKNSGNYYGVLMYKLQNSSYGIGTWVDLQITGNSLIEKINLISGETIQNIGSIKIGLISFSGILALILIILFIKLKRKKIEKLQ